MKFLISVPIGAYHPLLEECLLSLSIQSPNPNVALMDASCDPRVAALADRFDDLITYRRHGPDDGQSDAIIEGWANAPGDILGWLNADDALYPGALATAAAAFDTREALDVVYGNSVIINDDNAFTGYHWAVEPPSEKLLASDTISQPSCFFRRSAYEKIGGLNARLHYTMDWDLWVRFWRAGAAFGFADQTMSRVLWTGAAKTGGFNRARRAELEQIIGQHASPIRRAKSRAGFALHHAFEYVLPQSIARPIRRRLTRSSATINGIGRNGELLDGASMPLVHYRAEPVTGIEIEFDSDAAVTVSSDRHGDTVRAVDRRAVLLLDAPWPHGETLLLSFRPEPENRASLSQIHLT